jgi:hypothetical protein
MSDVGYRPTGGGARNNPTPSLKSRFVLSTRQNNWDRFHPLWKMAMLSLGDQGSERAIAEDYLSRLAPHDSPWRSSREILAK